MKNKEKHGSALIMTVVLTVLLAIVAVMFVAVARMDVAATSNIADNKMLDSAAKSIISIISKELILDTPGVALKANLLPKTSYPQYYDYYDYADTNDPWLASLQPYRYKKDPNMYRWHQISDVTGYLRQRFSVDPNWNWYDVNVGTTTIDDYPPITITNGQLDEILADADGDGIGDAKWFELENLCSSKGQRIYAAVRVIDNCGMVNINTAHTFDETSVFDANIDGSSQMQINLEGLLKVGDSINTLHDARCGSASQVWTDYNDNVIWQYDFPYDDTTGKDYLPFDISDELELRYRYCIDSKFESRFEKKLLQTTDAYGEPGSLYDGDPNWDPCDWGFRITEPNDPCDKEADRRHLLTTYNYDRIIDPNGDRMINVNTESDPNKLYRAIRQGLLAAPNHQDANVAAQITVNIIDYRDGDSNVTDFNNPDNDTHYYGFEAQPFISEIFVQIGYPPVPINNDYAVELYNPFNVSIDLSDFTLSIVDQSGAPVFDINSTNGLNGIIDANDFFVASFIQPHTFPCPNDSSVDLLLSGSYIDNEPDGTFDSWSNYNLILKRKVGLNEVILDVQDTNNVWFAPPLPPPAPSPLYFFAERDTSDWRVVYQQMLGAAGHSLGLPNPTPLGGHNYNLYMKNDNFATIGDIARPLKIGPNTVAAGTIGQRLALTPLESDVRMDLTDPNYQQIFNYLTVIDPNNYINDTNEMRVKGRINLNTAPWYVIRQLPWVSRDCNDANLARAIVAYRDRTWVRSEDANFPSYVGRSGGPGIAGIGELNRIVLNGTNNDPNFSIAYYSRTDGPANGDQIGFPDLDSPSGDGAADDFEERNLIFSRISNLVTVRSDVFTAYILVRVCTNVNSSNEVQGPQKRYMAILDRTGVTSHSDKVKIISFHPVPGAR